MLSLDKAVQDFMREQVLRNNSKDTLSYYRISLKMFSDFVFDVVGDNANTDDLTIDMYKNYVFYLLQKTALKSSSVHTYLRAVKAFLNYLINEEIIPDYSRKIKLIRQDREVILPLSDTEIHKLLNHFNIDTVLGLRNKCIVLLMLDCGLRKAEVVKLLVNDVLWDRNLLLINGKGHKQRLVPFGQTVKEHLLKYYNVCRLSAMPSEHFFLNYYEEKPITRNTIHCLFAKLKSKTGITRLHPHLLRHTFATLYIIEGGNLETLRVILGHTTISMTQKYLHLATNYKLAYEKHNSHIDNIME